jgi:hypothetical protein
MDRHQRECLAGRQQKFLNAGNAYAQFLRYPFSAFLEGHLRKCRIPVWFYVSYVTDTKALEAIKPNTIANKSEKEELRADVKYVTANRRFLKSTRESNEALLAHHLCKLR